MAKRIAHNPHQDICPNFAGPDFVRAALTAGRNITAEQATQQITDTWNVAHEANKTAWDAQQAADEVDAVAAVQCLGKKVKAKMANFIEGESVDDYIILRPAAYAISKITVYKYVELWYFTREGCTKAQDYIHTTADDALGLEHVGNTIALWQIASVKASKNVVKDVDLTWQQLNQGKNNFLEYIQKVEWPAKHIKALTMFFVNLELHPIMNQPGGEVVLIAYQACV
ncbi:hypothetical protein H0H81_007337 [Sphagnurus paluster]|uniref:Uncharacterized protein n=1 Tax=Sphagnurus paluster TaxID=117069 RepID=A0A9P7FRD1_9AGAR|nr:hypothetical protein H0H81_007337 [Sphagnurus paluster]